MGLQISDLIEGKEIEISDLAGKKVAIDAFNTLFQFISIIRDRFTGEPLKDSKGRVTSHLSGILYRFTSLIENGLKPVIIFDGKPPYFKKQTLEEREEIKKQAETKWKEAVRRGEEAIKYAQAASRMTNEMLEDAKKLLDYMGIPHFQAPSEGEAACAVMCREGHVDYTASQDYDSLLFGSPRLVRNLSVSGKRKLPKQNTYVDVKPEVVELQKILKMLGVTREQLIIIGLLIGTDYNEGVRGVGPKTALKLVKEHKSLEKIMTEVELEGKTDIEEIYKFFLNPPSIEKAKIVWKEPQEDKIIKFMVDERSFSLERIQKAIERLKGSHSRGTQASLGGWLKK